MTQVPKISLVIPAYNEEKYIRDCLEHVSMYGKGFFSEIIVVDNASTDKTAEIAKSFPEVHVVKEERKGTSAARQCGFETATGDIIAFIDADTRMPKEWPGKVIESFANHPQIVSVSGPYVYYDMNKWQKFWVWVYWHILAVPLYWIIGYMIVGGNFAIRRDTLIKMNGFDTSIEFYGDDTNVARRASKFGKVLFTSSLVMITSGRRVIQGGLLKFTGIYGSNFFSEVLVKRPIMRHYDDIR